MNQASKTESREEHSHGRMLWALVLPYLLAIWSCLSIVQNDTADIPPAEILIPTILKVLFVVGLVHIVLILVVRKRPARELTLLTFVSFFALYGVVRSVFASADGMMSESLFLGIWGTVHALAVVVLFRINATKSTQSALFAMGVSAVIMVGFQIANVSVPVAGDLAQLSSLIKKVDDLSVKSDREIEGEQLAESFNKKAETLPDIYYIIVDAYARGDVLDQVYEFDNQPFTDSLESRGFYVADESRSNYNMTELSLASSLNMRHLSGLGLEEFKTRLPLRELIRENIVVKSLKESGYTTIAFETGKSETECQNFDRYVAYDKALCDYQDVLYHGTPLPALIEMTGATRSASRRHGDRTLFALDAIPKVATESSEPAFVFCHMLSPHPPYLFDEQGKEVDLHGHYLLADWIGFTSCFNYDLTVYRDGYREQLAFMNQKLIQMVDEIQKSNRQSIIIIQGDHGPRMGFGHRKSEWQDVEWRYRESFSILNAICMPSGSSNNANFYPAMTPVNTFRLIFNEIFHTELAMEDDASYLEVDNMFSDLTEAARPLKPEQETDVASQLSKSN